MFYKSSLLALTFLLLSISSVLAADFSIPDDAIEQQRLELNTNLSGLSVSKPQNSASIAKARLLGTSEIPASEIEITNEIASKSIRSQGSASIAKARLHSLAAKETPTYHIAPISPTTNLSSSLTTTAKSSVIDPKTIADQVKSLAHNVSDPSTVTKKNNHRDLKATQPPANSTFNNAMGQRKIASAISEVNAIEQWEINKSVTINDIVLTPVPAIAQVPERLPDNSTTLDTAKPTVPAVVAPQQLPISAPVPETQQPAITIESQNPTPAAQAAPANNPESQENEPKKWAVGVHTQLSTTGFIGVDAGYKFSPNLHARLGLNTVGFNVDYASQGIDYKANVSPTNVHLLGDFFPFGGGFRLTGGLVFQGNQFNATGKPTTSITGGITNVNIGGQDFNINDVGTVSSEGSFSNSVAPYLGIGFGTPLSPGLGFNFDAGVMFAGSPRVKLRANIPSTVRDIVQADIRNRLAEQERRTNNDISSFSVYPVISIGFSYAF